MTSDGVARSPLVSASGDRPAPLRAPEARGATSPALDASRRGRRPVAVTAGAGLAGAVTAAVLVRLAHSTARLGRPSLSFATPAAVVVGLIVGLALAACASSMASDQLAGVPLVAGGLAAYLCVPETDHLIPLLVVAVAVAVCQWHRRGVLNVVTFASLLAVLFDAALRGSAGRPSAVCGALFSVWPTLTMGVGTVLLRRAPRWAAGALLAVGSIATVGVARTGALARTGAGEATTSIALALLVTAVAAGALRWGPGRAAAKA